ncbi:MAG: phosphopentomutase [Candidatus Caenarcaniphilales bacterium]|nr:phosphopentomutase [Candidatus Caenarcaniphilales bacterium]
MKNRRAFLVVLDACGIGAMPDWQLFDDPPGANTIVNVAKFCGGLNIPNLQKLGIGNIAPILGVEATNKPIGSWGKAAETSMGKDTTTGHWEMAGLIVEKPFPVYPEGFPSEIIDEFILRTNCGGVLCNKPASGTEVLDKLGEAHLSSGWPIVYTSADSVFQIATHVDRIPLETLYSWCESAREILSGEHEASRVIARPFAGESKSAGGKGFYRLSEHRHDYAIKPRGRTLLNFLLDKGFETVSIGKINDIFCSEAISKALDGKSNEKCLENITQFIHSKNDSKNQFVFANLVETDSHFGHRNNAEGFADALQKIDLEVGNWINILKEDDLLILTADHGCDPTVPGTDHTREYVPILAYSPSLPPKSLGTRTSFTDTAATIADWFGLKSEWEKQQFPGVSFI